MGNEIYGFLIYPNHFPDIRKMVQKAMTQC